MESETKDECRPHLNVEVLVFIAESVCTEGGAPSLMRFQWTRGVRVQSSSNPGISAFYVPIFSLFVCLDPGLGNSLAVIAQNSLCVCLPCCLGLDPELIPHNAQEALFPLVTLGSTLGGKRTEGRVGGVQVTGILDFILIIALCR